MPLYDRICTACDWQVIDVWEAIYAEAPECPSCGEATKRAWLTKATTAICDECDFIQHNGTKHPIRFRSKSEFRRWLKQEGWRVKDSHVPEQGSDKSKFTTNWATCDPYTAENVRILLERAFHAPSHEEPPDEPLHVTMTCGEVGSAAWKKEMADVGK